MLILRLTMMEGRSEDQKRQLLKSLAQAAASELGCPVEDVRMVINEVPASNWGVAGVSMKDRAGGVNDNR